MDRSIDREEREPSPLRAREKPKEYPPVGDRPLDPRAQARGVEPDREDDRNRGSRRRQPAGGRRYSISPDERQTMYELGRFRVISANDLVEIRYRGSDARMRQDLRSLKAQALVQRKTVWTGRDREKQAYFALTQAGKRLLKRERVAPAKQALYAGFVKPAELAHDAAIYRAYHREAARIEDSGGRIRRVVLDYELKKKVYSPLAKAKGLAPAEYAARQAEIARQNGLKVVNGHIALPDLRIEYETREGVAASIDVEVASESYHGSHAAEKAAAGFTIYAASDTAQRLSRALEEREITAEILRL